ncbi:unnamed protein product [Brassica oleracea]
MLIAYAPSDVVSRSMDCSSYFLGVEFGLALVSYLMGFIDASLHCVHFCVPERLCPSVEDSKRVWGGHKIGSSPWFFL